MGTSGVEAGVVLRGVALLWRVWEEVDLSLMRLGRSCCQVGKLL